MGRVPYSEFVGSRARFQRLSDQRIFSGWLDELRHDRISVTAEESLEIGQNERFLFQIQGPSADAYMIGTSHTGLPSQSSFIGAVHGAAAEQVVDLPALSYDFAILTPVQLRDGQQIPRKALRTLVANLSLGEVHSEVLVIDGSPGGMGVIAWKEVARGSTVQIDIASETLQASFACEVRHCRPDTRLIGTYRLGLQFVKPDRIELVGWRKLLTPG